MKRTVAAVALATFLVSAFALPAPAADTGVKPEIYAAEMIRLAEWPATHDSVFDKPGGPPCVLGFEREELVPGIAHYWFDLRIGSGTYDVLRIHRVVKERRPFVPKRARDSIFLQHGDLYGFGKFIFGSLTDHLPDESSVATYLAEAGWDVWGVDQPWIHVPADETEFEFARDWGMQFEVDNVDRGIDVARAVRLFTGNGWRKMKLLGYSSGGFVTYAYMNQQTQRPPGLRGVDAYVIADAWYKFDRSDPVFAAGRLVECANADFNRSENDNGVYMADLGFLALVGNLAEDAPDDPSPIFPGFTNLQAALFLGAVPDPAGSIPWYHFMAPLYENGNPLPVGLRFTQVGAWLDFMQGFVPWEPTAFFRDYGDVICDELDVPWDDHLGGITEPMILLAPLGGIGSTGYYTLDLLGTTDKTIAEFSFFPPNELDYGHIDMWTADNCLDTVFPTLLGWLEDHSGAPGMIAARETALEEEGLRVAPNPGHGPYTFSFEMASTGEADVEVFDVGGRRVASLRSGAAAAGTHRVVWDGRNAQGHPIAEGVYFARVQTFEGAETTRFVHRVR